MNIPQDLRYTKEHEWVRLEGDTATIGITDYAQGELGDIVFIEVETVDEEVAADEVFGSIEAVKTVSDLFSPLAGEVASGVRLLYQRSGRCSSWCCTPSPARTCLKPIGWENCTWIN